MKHKPSSLTARFGLLLLLSATSAALAFGSLRFGGGLLLHRHFDRSDFQKQYDERRVQSFQSYVKKNGLSAADTAKITEWVRKNSLILLEIYRSNVLLYTSSAPDESRDNEVEAPYYAGVSYYNILFADGGAELVIYADDTYRFFTGLTFVSLGIAMLVFLFVFLHGCRALVRYICLLSGEIQAMEGGDLDVAITMRGNHELTQLARSLDSMRRTLREQMERESNIFRANQAMITAMSHDLRTPLTTLQIYTDILRYKKYCPDQLDGYLEKIDAKVAQIKQLSEHIFEYSLVSGSQMVELEQPRPVRDVFHDQISELVAYLIEQGFSFELDLNWPDWYVPVRAQQINDIDMTWPDVKISVCPQYVKRLLDNVTSNLMKYADAGDPIRIAIAENGGEVGIVFQNTIRSSAGQQDGTHIDIVNMKTMMKNMGGVCETSQTDSVFRTSLWFPVTQND